MSVGQNQNQLNQTPIKGNLLAIPSPFTVSCQILGTSASSLVAGSPVKLVSGTANQILIDLAGVADSIFGFVIYSPKKNKWAKSDIVEVAMTGSIMNMESGVSFNRGQTLECSSNTTVIPWAEVNSHIGKALDTATASGQIIRVYITTALDEGSSSSSSCSSSSSSVSSSSSSCRSSSSSSSSRSSSSSSSSCRSSSSSSSSSSCRSSSSSSSSNSSSSSSRSSSSSSRSSSSSSSSSSFAVGLP